MAKSCHISEEVKAAAEDMLSRLYDSILALTEDTVSLYDRIEDYFFQDIDYQMVKGLLS